MTDTIDAPTADGMVETIRQSDGYLSHYRRWGAADGDDVVVMLHGGVSHSAWQAPLGEALTTTHPVSFVALDRRGSGLNDERRGHLVSAEREIADVSALLDDLGSRFRRVHLAGWCFGAQVAALVAAERADAGSVRTLILVTPGFVFNERYSDVLRLSVEAVETVVAELGVKVEPDRAYVPVPLQPRDFTSRETWLEFIVNDPLWLRTVSENTLTVWDELAERSHKALAALGDIPVLTVYGSQDRLVDNPAVQDLISRAVPGARAHTIDAPHAIHFERRDEQAALIGAFLREHIN